MTAIDLANILYKAVYRYANEKELQRAISQILDQSGISWKAEVPLTPKDRIDFMVGDIGIEVKTDGSQQNVLRQLYRYACLPEIKALILVTTRQNHRHMPPQLDGKSCLVVFLINSFL